jgi:hypothetical protein
VVDNWKVLYLILSILNGNEISYHSFKSEWEVCFFYFRVIMNYELTPDGPRPTTLLPSRSNGKPETATGVDKLLMIGMKMPKTY